MRVSESDDEVYGPNARVFVKEMSLDKMLSAEILYLLFKNTIFLCLTIIF